MCATATTAAAAAAARATKSNLNLTMQRRVTRCKESEDMFLSLLLVAFSYLFLVCRRHRIPQSLDVINETSAADKLATLARGGDFRFLEAC